MVARIHRLTGRHHEKRLVKEDLFWKEEVKDVRLLLASFTKKKTRELVGFNRRGISEGSLTKAKNLVTNKQHWQRGLRGFFVCDL